MAVIRPKRACAAKETGYYTRLNDIGLSWRCDIAKEDTLMLSEEMEDVFEVERLVERRLIKGKAHYLALWKHYPKEEASWISSSEITETAIRLFHEPQPPMRTILDAVSSFSLAIQTSLHAGALRKCNISLEFPRHVFNFLFSGKGMTVRSKPGRLYERNDFMAPYFNDDHFKHYNKYREGYFIAFPVYMYSFVKMSPQSYRDDGTPAKRGFTETLSIKVVKTLEMASETI